MWTGAADSASGHKTGSGYIWNGDVHAVDIVWSDLPAYGRYLVASHRISTRYDILAAGAIGEMQRCTWQMARHPMSFSQGLVIILDKGH